MLPNDVVIPFIDEDTRFLRYGAIVKNWSVIRRVLFDRLRHWIFRFLRSFTEHERSQSFSGRGMHLIINLLRYYKYYGARHVIGCLTLISCSAMAGQATKADVPCRLWDGAEPITEYAKRNGVAPSLTISLGGGVTMDLALVPAGRFIVGKPFPESEWTGLSILIASSIIFIYLCVAVVITSVRKRKRLQFSLRWLLLVVIIIGFGQYGAFRWRQAVEDWRGIRRHPCPGPEYGVTIEKPFYICKYEITQKQYSIVMGNNPSIFKNDAHPVETISWDNAKRFCNIVSALSGYVVRLPYEAEWEYACRGGLDSDYGSIKNEHELAAFAWYKSNSRGSTQPVGSKRANPFGLYDMLGNVNEWCEDDYCYRPFLTETPNIPFERQSYRVICGGSWEQEADSYQFYKCLGASHDKPYSDIGFRVVIEIVKR